MRRDAYTTFIGAKGVAFAWIGAAFGPMFFAIGLNPDYRGHLAVGIVALILVALSFSDGVRALKRGSVSDFLAYAIVPSLLLVAGSAYVWLAAPSA